MERIVIFVGLFIVIIGAFMKIMKIDFSIILITIGMTIEFSAILWIIIKNFKK